MVQVAELPKVSKQTIAPFSGFWYSRARVNLK
jgi:hypothetical protein